jgi:type IV secretory pathway VirJ component
MSTMKFLIFMQLCFSVFFSEKIVLSQTTELPLRIKSAPESSRPMVFYITGDGGWNSFDKKMANEYELYTMPYIGLNSLKYFWSKKSPDQLAKDIVPVLYRYMKEWDKKEIIMVGYSFGAEILPFLYTRLPNNLKESVKLITLITPYKTSDFTIHLNDMLMFDGKYQYDVVAEIGKIEAPNILCLFGSSETSIFGNSNQQKNLKIQFIKGWHRFSDSDAVMQLVLNEIK